VLHVPGSVYGWRVMSARAKPFLHDMPDQPTPDEVAGRLGVELVFYGQMALVAEANAILAETDYGRAHFRTLYMIARSPGITAGGLLTRLKIANQSLARVMGSLVRDGMVVQQVDQDDRRHRRHFLSQAGAELEAKVLAAQLQTLGRAYEAAGPDAMRGFWRVLLELMPEADRALLTYPFDGHDPA
jgi:DNA-binding MarR family transcriptional regulator